MFVNVGKVFSLEKFIHGFYPSSKCWTVKLVMESGPFGALCNLTKLKKNIFGFWFGFGFSCGVF